MSHPARLLHAKPDNPCYNFWGEQAEPGQFMLNELNALVAHCRRADSEHFLALINNLVERSAFTLEPLAIG